MRRPAPLPGPALAVVVLALVGGACGTSGSSTTDTPVTTATSPPPATTAPDTTVPTTTVSTTTVADSTTSSTIEDGLPIGGPELPGMPEIVAEREPLPYCGARAGQFLVPERDLDFAIEFSDDAAACFAERVASGLPVEYIEIDLTIEGDPIVLIHRIDATGRYVRFWDATRDRFGSQSWEMVDCPSYDAAFEECTLTQIG